MRTSLLAIYAFLPNFDLLTENFTLTLWACTRTVQEFAEVMLRIAGNDVMAPVAPEGQNCSRELSFGLRFLTRP